MTLDECVLVCVLYPPQTVRNWSRTEEATDHPISVPSSLRQLVRRQNLHSRIVIEVPLNPTSESMEEEHNAVVSSQLV